MSRTQFPGLAVMLTAAARLRGRTVLPWDRSWEQGPAVRCSMPTTTLTLSLIISKQTGETCPKSCVVGVI